MNKRYIKYFFCIESSQLPSLSSSVLVSLFLGQTLVRILLMNLDAITTLLRRDNTRDLLFAWEEESEACPANELNSSAKKRFRI